MKQYDWTSNKADTLHSVRIYENGKVVARLPQVHGDLLKIIIEDLEDAGYTHKD